MHHNKLPIIVRTCVLFVALVNQLLMVFGYTILPISEQQVSELCTTFFTIGAALWTWWTDNRIDS